MSRTRFPAITLLHFAALACAPFIACQTPIPNPPPNNPPPIGPLPVWNAARFPWPMFAQNVRRTARSPFNGPTSADPAAPTNWTYFAVGAAAINIQAVLSNNAVYFGSWGVLRRDLALSPDRWDKGDGRFYALHLADAAPNSQERFPPVLPAVTPVGYLLPGRNKLPRDQFWCGANNDYLVSFYNGTIEGTPCLDPRDGTIYVGRGDGRLFAIDPETGGVEWSFQTFNPQRPNDPDGGGEVIGGPVMGPDHILYFATGAVPWPGNPPNDPCYETNAVYAIDANGDLVWRYPASAATLDNWIVTPPALSSDGRTLYVGTFGTDVTVPGRILAFDLAQPPGASDADRLRWSFDVRNDQRLFQPFGYARAIAVGADGRIFVAGCETQFLGLAPVVFALRDRGNRAEYAWPIHMVEPHGYPSSTAQFTAGLAIVETGQDLDVLYASTTHLRTSNGEGGALFAINPANGSILHTFDPASRPQPGVGGMTAPTVDAAGRIYVGIRGKHPTIGAGGVNGRMYGLTYNAASGFSVLWEFEVDGQLDWVPPAIGANGGLYFGSTPNLTPGEEITWFAPGQVPADRTAKFSAVFE
ncbi:MAG: PQQ-binding-like beta-propeller repeat protein [Phycisphaerae bacterium]|nr:PQQ-binding-like beta-propeller repeat protein [Phycisphaerae bacterium]